MSNDFIFVMTEAPPLDMNGDVARERLRATVFDLGEEICEQILENNGLATGSVNLVGITDEELAGFADEAFKELAVMPASLNNFMTYTKDGRSVKMWITGGLSQGDTPTDSWDSVALLAEIAAFSNKESVWEE